MFSNSVRQLDSIIDSLEKELGVPPSPIDPDDPWARTSLVRSQQIAKVNCPKCKSYKITLPFESVDRCPLCFFQDKSKIPEQFKLLPTEEIIKRLKVTGGTTAEPPKKQQKQQQSPAASTQQPADKGAQQPAQEKKGKQEAKPQQQKTSDPYSDFGKCQLQVSKILSAKKHPEADKLWHLEVDVGGSTRSVCAGLVGHYSAEELTGRLVVTILNLKPKKMKGVESAAMVLAGDNAQTGKVSLLVPPSGSQVGDALSLQGHPRATPDKVLSGNVWTVVVPELKVVGSKAMYKDKVIVTDKGEINVPDLPDGSGIH